MSDKPLNIIKEKSKPEGSGQFSSRAERRRKTEARFDRCWLIEPEKMSALRNCLERERISRTEALIRKYVALPGKRVVDLGCGDGAITAILCESGANVDAVDISANALKKMQELAIKAHLVQDYVPMTALADDFYDLVVSLDLIGDLPEDEHRLYVSELSRLVKFDGDVVCSTELDIYSEDALELFGRLAETEFDIKEWVFSYHKLYIQLKKILSVPNSFIDAYKNTENRQKELSKRKGLSLLTYRLNSSLGGMILWMPLSILCSPLLHSLKENRSVLLALEKVTRFFWNESGVSHALFIGKRRPLYEAPSPVPRETKHKKQVWE